MFVIKAQEPIPKALRQQVKHQVAVCAWNQCQNAQEFASALVLIDLILNTEYSPSAIAYIQKFIAPSMDLLYQVAETSLTLVFEPFVVSGVGPLDVNRKELRALQKLVEERIEVELRIPVEEALEARNTDKPLHHLYWMEIDKWYARYFKKTEDGGNST